jgi:hypothetical protein
VEKNWPTEARNAANSAFARATIAARGIHVGTLVTKGQPWSPTFPHIVEFDIEELSVSQPLAIAGTVFGDGRKLLQS